MVEHLKRMAMQKLAEKMMGNSLGQAETQQAAEEGANGILETITGALGGGGVDQVKDLFSSGGNVEENGLFQNIQNKLQQTLEAKGMSSEEAATEAANTTPDLINSLKEKFESPAEEDSAFDIGSLTSLIGGNGGDLLGKAGGIFNAAKNILGK